MPGEGSSAADANRGCVTMTQRDAEVLCRPGPQACVQIKRRCRTAAAVCPARALLQCRAVMLREALAQTRPAIIQVAAATARTGAQPGAFQGSAARRRHLHIRTYQHARCYEACLPVKDPVARHQQPRRGAVGCALVGWRAQEGQRRAARAKALRRAGGLSDGRAGAPDPVCAPPLARVPSATAPCRAAHRPEAEVSRWAPCTARSGQSLRRGPAA